LPEGFPPHGDVNPHIGGVIMLEDRLLKIDQCLEITPVARSTWWQKVAEGQLPQPVKIGASTRWRHSDLMAFIANMPVSDQPKAQAGV
jgi:prophage regulatory protein